MPTARTKTAPPPAAVAQDAHWAAKMARLRARALPEVTLRICDDPAVKTTLAAARLLADTARRQVDALSSPTDGTDQSADEYRAAALDNARQDLRRAEADLADAQAAYDEASIVLRFRALPKPALAQLLKDHPQSDDEDDSTGDDPFLVALIAASSVDGMTEDDVRELLDTWSNADARALGDAANAAQHQSRTDLGKG